MKIKRHGNGVYYARVWTTVGVRRVSLRTREIETARRRAREAKLADIEHAARVNALTSDTVGRILAGRQRTGSDVLTAWRGWAYSVGLSPNTMAQYAAEIGAFLRETGLESKAIASATERYVDQFVNPTNSKVVVSTRRHRLAALASFFRFAQAKGMTVGSPADLVRVKLAGLQFTQKEPKRRLPFTDAELTLLRSIEDPFWRTFVLLGEHYGLRLSDVAQLERACVAKPGHIIVWTDKRDRRIDLPLTPPVRDQLLALDVSHPVYFFPREAAIAADPKRRAILSVEFGRILRRLGITGKSAHCLRHRFATKLAQSGRTVDEIRATLGHASPAATVGYLHVSDRQVT